MSTAGLTVRTQLTLAFGGLIAGCALIAGTAVYGLSSANERFRGFVEGVNTRSQLVARLGHSMKDRAVAARNLILALDPAQREAQANAAAAAHKKVGDLLARYNTAVDSASDMGEKARALAKEINRVETAYAPVALSIVDMARRGQQEAAIAKLNAECVPLLDKLNKVLDEYVDVTEQAEKARIEDAESSYLTQRAWLLGTAGLALAAAVMAGWVITRRLTRALGAEPADLSAIVGRVADGDLNSIAGASQAPAGSVLASLARMQSNLVRLIGQVRTAADSIATASAQIATGNTDLSGRTETQASALQQTSAQMHQMTDSVRANASGARQASELAGEAARVAGEGGAVVERVVGTMGQIDESSRRIANIIATIDGIAFQTNILALNAAVEAARAGDQGRGFAVVAGEVRALARRSADAAKEIKSLIDSSVERVQAGSQQVTEAGTTMQRIVEQVRKVTDLIAEIHSATDEQTAGIEQVNQAVSSLDQGTQQNAALVEESAAAAESLRQQAEELTRLVAAFRLEGSMAR